MRGIDNSYFHELLCDGTHYVVIGHTEDRFCTDDLQLLDVRLELHRYLLEQGFDAVFFFDELMKLYCFDDRSFRLFRKGSVGSRNNTRHKSRMKTKRPGSSRQAEVTNEPEELEYAGERLNLGNISNDIVWMQLTTLLSTTEYRVALILNSPSTFQFSLPAAVIQLFQELLSYRTKNHSVIIYIFRKTDLDNMESSIARGSASWSKLFDTVIKPCIDSDSADTNRLISLGTPNASEVRNLLNYLRLREDNSVPIDPMEMNELAFQLSNACARKDWGLRKLLQYIEHYSIEHPNKEIGISDWKSITGEENYQSPTDRLNSLVGIEELKKYVELLRSTYFNSIVDDTALPKLSSRLSAFDVSQNSMGHRLNIQFRGDPGTGKTTIARLIGEIYKEYGLLPQGHTIETNAAELVSSNIGGTTSAVRSKVLEALGGVLFIDEVYQLLTNDHGREAIDQLVADMSRYEGQFAVVVAGYPDQVRDFMRSNPGLSRRFPTVFELPSYTGSEMHLILNRTLERMNSDQVERSSSLRPRHYSFSDELRSELENFCENWVNGRNATTWGNAGEAENLILDMINHHDRRLMHLGSEKNDILDISDIPENLRSYLEHRSQKIEDALNKIDEMIGLNNIKTFLRQLARNIQLGSDERVPGNYVFHGPPGTGKTHTARMMGEMLHLLGVLKRGHVIERKGGELNLDADDKTNGLLNAVRDARGGVLFIDEAHQLEDSVIRALVPIIEEPEFHGDTAVVLAGYSNEINDMLANADPGLTRRFPLNHRIRFDHYTAKELRDILEEMALKQGEIPTEGYLNRSENALSNYLDRIADSNFGNAGYIRDTYLPDSVSARTNRLSEELTGSLSAIPTDDQIKDLDEKSRRELTEYDIPANMISYAGPVGFIDNNVESTRRLVSELYGKQEIVDFINSKLNDSDDSDFYDSIGSSGMNVSVCGPLGCGKHTVCYALHSLWHDLGLLTGMKPHFTNETELVSGYVSQTPAQTTRVIQNNIGTTLVIENPSSMLPKGQDGTHSFGPEALNVIAGAMQSYSGRISFILLDSEEGLERLFREYPSIKSSLNREFKLDELSYDEMFSLFDLKTRNSFHFTGRLAEEGVIRDFILNLTTDRGGLGDSPSSWGNGLEIDSLCSEIKEKYRLKYISKNDRKIYKQIRKTVDSDGIEKEYTINLREIDESLIPEKYQKYLVPSSEVADTALKKLNDLTGLHSVKKAIAAVERRIHYSKDKKDVIPGLYCFIGNPGVGKTKVAKLMGGVLKAAGVLEIGHVVERTARQIAEDYQNFERTLKLARKGVLFIDEAHQLRENPVGNEVIKRLLTAIEDTDVIKDTCIILAGYPAEMRQLLMQDKGLNSRFETGIIEFDDYNSDELTEILKVMSAEPDQYPQIGAKEPLELDERYIRAAKDIFDAVLNLHNPDYGNARFIRNFLHMSYDKQLERLDRTYGRENEVPAEVLHQLVYEDIPDEYSKILLMKYSHAEINTEYMTTDEQTELVNMDYSEMVNTIARYSVYLHIEFENGKGSGTGTIISSDGYVLTANHNVEDADGNLAREIKARLYTPGAVGGDYSVLYDCEILSSHDRNCDMALLKLKGYNYPHASIRPAELPIDIDEKIVIVAYPMGSRLTGYNEDVLRYSHKEGMITSIQIKNGLDHCYADITALHGESGAGIFSMKDGRLIGVFTGSITSGMNSLQIPNFDELNFFYPVKYFWDTFQSNLL